MCDPVTLGVGSLAIGALGAGMSGLGMINQQAAQGAQSRYMQQVSLQQQQAGQMQAADAKERGRVAESKQREITEQRIGTQTAALAAQGTDLAGSPTDILGDTARAGERDALTVRSNAAREAWGYEVGAGNAAANAALHGSFSPSYLGAGASLLSGASGLADKWSRFQYAGGGSQPVSGDAYMPGMLR